MKRLATLLCWAVPMAANAQGQPSLVSVVFNPPTVTGGTSSTATITISAPARQNGFEISLSLNSTIAQLGSSTITIAEGQSSEVVPVTTNPVASSQVVILSATTRTGTRSGALTIAPPSLSSITIAPSSVISGKQAAATITLTGSAPSGGFPVDLSSSSNTAVPVPASVNVPAGQRTGNVPLTTGAVSAQTTVTLTAGASGSSKTATLTVLPNVPTITFLQYPANPTSGARPTFTINLSGPAPARGTIVEVYTTGADVLQQNGIFRFDTIPQGQTRVSRTAAVPLTSVDRAFEIVATLDGTTTRHSGTLRAPTIAGLAIADSMYEGTTIPLTVTLNGTPHSTGFPVVITSTDPSAISSPGAVSGANKGGTVIYTIRANEVSRRTPVTLAVERGGTVHRVSTSVIPRPPVLTNFAVEPSPVRAGESVTFRVAIDKPAPPGGTAVQLSASSSAIQLPVPSTIVIPEGATRGALTVKTTKLPGSTLSLSVDVTVSLGNTQRTLMLMIRS